MILRMPAYCRDFKCSAGDCSDSCCIGWEIDIDEKTALYYLNAEGGFGERLKNGISAENGYSFILKNERCPFLNDRNLCDIILNMGEDKLCHICAEHPRYYEWFDGVKEGGVGLCCEEAARLILLHGCENTYTETEIPYESCDEYDSGLYRFLYEAREKITDRLRSEIPLKTAVADILSYTNHLQYCIDNGETTALPPVISSVTEDAKADISGMLEIFRRLEPIDEKWKPYIDSLEASAEVTKHSGDREKYIRSIGIYFIWRYFLKGVFDEEIISKVKFAVIAMAMAGLMFSTEENADINRCAELSKNYSKETEYSEENLEYMYDMAYTEQIFSDKSLTAFFK